VRVRVRRDCVSHTARSRDRTRAGIISPPRGTKKFLPSHWSHWTNLYRYSPRSLTFTFLFHCRYFRNLRTSHHLYFPVGSWSTTQKERNLLEIFVTARIRRFMNGSLTYFVAPLS